MASCSEGTPGLQLENRRARLEFCLWSALVGLAVADGATTIVAIAVGLPEANPLVGELLHAAGPLSLIPVKAAYLALGFAVWRVVDPSGRVPALTVAVVLSAAVVVNNLAWIIFAGGL